MFLLKCNGQICSVKKYFLFYASQTIYTPEMLFSSHFNNMHLIRSLICYTVFSYTQMGWLIFSATSLWILVRDSCAWAHCVRESQYKIIEFPWTTIIPPDKLYCKQWAFYQLAYFWNEKLLCLFLAGHLLWKGHSHYLISCSSWISKMQRWWGPPTLVSQEGTVVIDAMAS